MRFSLIDLLFAIVCMTIGLVLGSSLSAHVPAYLRPLAGPAGAICIYLAFIYPFYRGLKLFPMILPRCPCCGEFQNSFHILAVGWPRVRYRCPTCAGEFIIWHNGTPGDRETWKDPVLALKWPYAWGIYRRVNQPDTVPAPNADSFDAPSVSDE